MGSRRGLPALLLAAVAVAVGAWNAWFPAATATAVFTRDPEAIERILREANNLRNLLLAYEQETDVENIVDHLAEDLNRRLSARAHTEDPFPYYDPDVPGPYTDLEDEEISLYKDGAELDNRQNDVGLSDLIQDRIAHYNDDDFYDDYGDD